MKRTAKKTVTGWINNLSWNCGIEGPSEYAAVEELRRRQVKNLIISTLISIGVPMLLMGDEMRRTQRGNNNAYCQDNEISWLDWSLLERHSDIHRFVRTAIAHRLRWREWIETEIGAAQSVGPSLNELLRSAHFHWHGIRLGQPDWGEDSHSLACTIRSGPGHLPFWLHVMFNAYWEALDFDLPAVPENAVSGWQRWIDTARESPEDIVDMPAAPPVPESQYHVMPRSVAVLAVRIGARSDPAFGVEGKES